MHLDKPWAADPISEPVSGSLHKDRVLLPPAPQKLLARFCAGHTDSNRGISLAERATLIQLLNAHRCSALAYYVQVRPAFNAPSCMPRTASELTFTARPQELQPVQIGNGKQVFDSKRHAAIYSFLSAVCKPSPVCTLLPYAAHEASRRVMQLRQLEPGSARILSVRRHVSHLAVHLAE